MGWRGCKRVMEKLGGRPSRSVAAIALLFVAQGVVADVGYDELVAWVQQSPVLDPPAAGQVIDINGVSELAPWVPPGYIDEFQFDDVRVEIQETRRYDPHPVYRQASEQFAGESAIGADGSLQKYTAGRPFSDDQIRDADGATAGYMVAWNQIHRWQYYGYKVDELTMAYVAPGPATGPLNPDAGLNGGGSMDRILTQAYHRVYLNHLAMLPETAYQVEVADSDTRFFKDYIAFLDPFNIKGTRFVVERMLDPHADDQVNTYLPTERRVRRFSAKERADSFMGSNATLDDFEGFSGRVLDYKWNYIGRKRLLFIADAKNEQLQTYGPMSRFPDERWQVRDCHVIDVRSVWDGHPYRSRILFIDAETYAVPLSLVINHDDLLWKTMQSIHRAPRQVDDSEASLPYSVVSWRGALNVDRFANTATVVRAVTETEHPTMNRSQIKRIFSVSSLTSGQ